jgi:hypothetical protein
MPVSFRASSIKRQLLLRTGPLAACKRATSGLCIRHRPTFQVIISQTRVSFHCPAPTLRLVQRCPADLAPTSDSRQSHPEGTFLAEVAVHDPNQNESFLEPFRDAPISGRLRSVKEGYMKCMHGCGYCTLYVARTRRPERTMSGWQNASRI